MEDILTFENLDYIFNNSRINLKPRKIYILQNFSLNKLDLPKNFNFKLEYYQALIFNQKNISFYLIDKNNYLNMFLIYNQMLIGDYKEVYKLNDRNFLLQIDWYKFSMITLSSKNLNFKTKQIFNINNPILNNKMSKNLDQKYIFKYNKNGFLAYFNGIFSLNSLIKTSFNNFLDNNEFISYNFSLVKNNYGKKSLLNIYLNNILFNFTSIIDFDFILKENSFILVILGVKSFKGNENNNLNRINNYKYNLNIYNIDKNFILELKKKSSIINSNLNIKGELLSNKFKYLANLIDYVQEVYFLNNNYILIKFTNFISINNISSKNYIIIGKELQERLNFFKINFELKYIKNIDNCIFLGDDNNTFIIEKTDVLNGFILNLNYNKIIYKNSIFLIKNLNKINYCNYKLINGKVPLDKFLIQEIEIMDNFPFLENNDIKNNLLSFIENGNYYDYFSTYDNNLQCRITTKDIRFDDKLIFANVKNFFLLKSTTTIIYIIIYYLDNKKIFSKIINPSNFREYNFNDLDNEISQIDISDEILELKEFEEFIIVLQKNNILVKKNNDLNDFSLDFEFKNVGNIDIIKNEIFILNNNKLYKFFINYGKLESSELWINKKIKNFEIFGNLFYILDETEGLKIIKYENNSFDDIFKLNPFYGDIIAQNNINRKIEENNKHLLFNNQSIELTTPYFTDISINIISFTKFSIKEHDLLFMLDSESNSYLYEFLNNENFKLKRLKIDIHINFLNTLNSNIIQFKYFDKIILFVKNLNFFLLVYKSEGKIIIKKITTKESIIDIRLINNKIFMLNRSGLTQINFKNLDINEKNIIKNFNKIEYFNRIKFENTSYLIAIKQKDNFLIFKILDKSNLNVLFKTKINYENRKFENLNTFSYYNNENIINIQSSYYSPNKEDYIGEWNILSLINNDSKFSLNSLICQKNQEINCSLNNSFLISDFIFLIIENKILQLNYKDKKLKNIFLTNLIYPNKVIVKDYNIVISDNKFIYLYSYENVNEKIILNDLINLKKNILDIRFHPNNNKKIIVFLEENEIWLLGFLIEKNSLKIKIKILSQINNITSTSLFGLNDWYLWDNNDVKSIFSIINREEYISQVILLYKYLIANLPFIGGLTYKIHYEQTLKNNHNLIKYNFINCHILLEFMHLNSFIKKQIFINSGVKEDIFIKELDQIFN